MTYRKSFPAEEYLTQPPVMEPKEMIHVKKEKQYVRRSKGITGKTA